MNKTALVIVALLSVNAAFAEDAPQAPDQKGFVAALAGPAFIVREGDGNQFMYGGRVGFTIGQSPVATGSLGIALSTMARSQTISGIEVDGRSTFLAAEYVARDAWGTGLYFGGRLGVGLMSADVSANGNSVSGSSTVFASAPVIGFEAKISPTVGLMLDASWVNFAGGTLTFPTASIEHNGGGAIAIQGGLSVNF